MKNITYDEIIKRVGYFRLRANLSMRELSQRLGYNPQFIKTIENGKIELKVKTLLDICEIVGITLQDFFYLGSEYCDEDKNLLELYSKLSKENKLLVIDLIKKLW